MRVLAGDLGGTKTALLIIECTDKTCEILARQRYPSAQFDGLHTIVDRFFEDTQITAETVGAACFGVAGPVNDNPAGFQTATITNLPWELNSQRLSDSTGINKLRIINDFSAIGYGLQALQPQDLITLQTGLTRPHAPQALIGAGTGLGTGYLIWCGQHYEVYPAEGGHADFAPNDPLQLALLHNLQQRFGHVSYERVLSGAGLTNLFSFLLEHHNKMPSQALREAMDKGDPAAAISEYAMQYNDPIAEQALSLFTQIYGHCAGNLALHYLARGGVFVAGGIAPKIIEPLSSGTFIQAFCDKGRMTELIQTIPVYLVNNPLVGALGAGLAASRL
jgi:glucokinase